jgi:hypothetical protein
MSSSVVKPLGLYLKELPDMSYPTIPWFSSVQFYRFQLSTCGFSLVNSSTTFIGTDRFSIYIYMKVLSHSAVALKPLPLFVYYIYLYIYII